MPVGPLEVLFLKGVRPQDLEGFVTDDQIRQLEDRVWWRKRAEEAMAWWDMPVLPHAKAWVDETIDAVKMVCIETKTHYLPPPFPFTQRVAVDLISYREERGVIRADASVYLTEQSYEFACRGGYLQIYHILSPERFRVFADALQAKLGREHVHATDLGHPILLE